MHKNEDDYTTNHSTMHDGNHTDQRWDIVLKVNIAKWKDETVCRDMATVTIFVENN
jgi:hypothetical protein